MNKIYYLLLIVPFLFASACQTELESSPMQDIDNELSTMQYPDSPGELVTAFQKKIFLAASSEGADQLALIAFEMLSDDAQSELNTIKAGYLCRLHIFTNAGYSQKKTLSVNSTIESTDEKVFVETSWQYRNDQAACLKTFELVKEHGQWKIAGIH